MNYKAIFLDVDGVLNAYNRIYDFAWRLSLKLKISDFVRSHYDVFGVRTYRVFLLWIIVKFTGADIVLSSSWRHGFMDQTKEKHGRQKELQKKLSWFGLTVVGVTGRVSSEGRYSDRGLEIQEYLNKHNYITNYVVIDDEKFDIIDTLGDEHLILTSRDGVIKGHPYENTGLKIKNVIRAIKILNRKGF